MNRTTVPRWTLAATMFLVVCAARAGWAGSANSLMDVSVDGRLLAAANRDSGTVTIVDATQLVKLREIPVGSKPEGVTFVGSTHELAVAVYGDDCVVFLDADTGRETGRVDVFDEPYGLVSDRAGQRLYLTLDFPGQVVELDAGSRSITRTWNAGSFARGAALTADEHRLLVTEYYTARVVAIDLENGQVVDEWKAAGTDNLARQIAAHPRRPKAYVPHIRSRTSAAQGDGSIFPYVSVIDLRPEADPRRRRIPMDAFVGNLVTSNPWEVTLSPDGRRLYVVFAGTDDLFACEVVDDDYRELAPAGHVRLGHNPRAVHVSPDGSRLFVYNALDFSILALDATSLEVQGTIPVCDNPLGDQILRGKILFYSALQPMVGRRWISCASCHPDGDPDGRTWQNPEGLRNTQSLSGLAWTHPIHWSADRDEVQDFEQTIRGPLMQGRGLLRGEVYPALGRPNAGRSSDLDALAAYTNSHHFARSPFAKGGLSESAQRGHDLFFSAETGCATCHPAPLYTDSTPQPAAQQIRHDVGTGTDDPTETLGPAYDTPTLLGVYRTAPYLHHGRAQSLEDVLTRCNTTDKHGKTSQLTAQQIADLVEFLKALPYEDPEAAKRLGSLINTDQR